MERFHKQIYLFFIDTTYKKILSIYTECFILMNLDNFFEIIDEIKRYFK